MGIREDVFYEGGPHIGDLVFNIFLGFTVICLPLTIGAITRALWVRYRITNRRISVTGGWMSRNRTDIVYSEVAKIVTVPRGVGLWGDMVITLKDGSRLEMKAVPKFRDIYDYVSDKLPNKAKNLSGALGER